jgi:cardiolipin synthase
MGQHLHAEITESNKVTTLINGVQIFPAMLNAIARATNTITFENFIWRSGELSDRFIEALSERAAAGVKVHCMVDSFGALKLKRADRRRLREAGVEFHIFNQIYPWNCWTWNHRTHRKTLVIDGKVGFIGGICIADEWDGDASEPNHWRDTEFMVEGPAVGQLQGIFMDNWMRVQSEVLHGDGYFPPIEGAGTIKAEAFKSGPQDGAENARLLYLFSIAAAKKSIRLSHSYFVPDNLAIDMLVAARNRGVKIEIITPGRIDWNIVRRAARSRWDKLLDAGVEFYEYQPSKYHCKLMIVDDVWVTCGSINFDDRSFRINGEGNINVYDEAFAAEQIRIFEQDKAKSVHITREKFKKRPLRIKLVEKFYGLFRGLL